MTKSYGPSLRPRRGIGTDPLGSSTPCDDEELEKAVVLRRHKTSKTWISDVPVAKDDRDRSADLNLRAHVSRLDRERDGPGRAVHSESSGGGFGDGLVDRRDRAESQRLGQLEGGVGILRRVHD